MPFCAEACGKFEYCLSEPDEACAEAAKLGCMERCSSCGKDAVNTSGSTGDATGDGGKNTCFFCALRLVFRGLAQTGEEAIVSSRSLRDALDSVYAAHPEDLFSKGNMNDAWEARKPF